MKFAIGIMTGTSVDALDACLIELTPSFKTILLSSFTSLPFEDDFRKKILKNMDPKKSSVEDICELNIELSRKAAEAVKNLLSQVDLKPDQISSIGYHGQTLWHMPDKGATYQIGDGPTLAALTGIPVVNNFRTKDMAYGGQGAPLVPFAHKILFHKDPYTKISVHNLGGISNLSYFSFTASLGFDTGPANLLIDALMNELFQKNYDEDGKVAKKGKVSEELLEKFLKDPFYKKKPPKSLPREKYAGDYIQTWLSEAKSLNLKKEDIITTATEFTVKTICLAYEDFVLPNGLDKIVFCGGGAKNQYLLERLQKEINVEMKTTFDFGFDPQAVESICFAILGYLGLQQQQNQIPELTGASQQSSLGQISYPD